MSGKPRSTLEALSKDVAASDQSAVHEWVAMKRFEYTQIGIIKRLHIARQTQRIVSVGHLCSSAHLCIRVGCVSSEEES